MPQPTLQVIDANSITQTVNTINPNGSATSANSQPVVLASDQVGSLASSANQSSMISSLNTLVTNSTNQTTDTAAATVSVSANTQNVNTTNFDLITFQVTAISGTLNFKASVDGVQTAVPFFAVPVAGGSSVSAITTTGLYQADCGAIDQLQFQSAGTATIVYVMSATGTVVTVDNFPATTGANNADAQATVSTGLSASLGYGYLFNGTTWDRQREVAGDAQAATGLTAAVGMLWNGTTYDRTKSGLTAQQSAATGIPNEIAMGVVSTGNPALTTAFTAPVSLTLLGGQRIDLSSVGATAISTGTGAGGAGIPRVTISNDSSLAANQSVNINQIAASTPITSIMNGSTNKGLGVIVTSAGVNTDYSAAAFAGSGSVAGALISPANGDGLVCSFDINVTTLTLGTATSVIFVLQESYDNGTTWTDIYTTQPITATGHTRIPPVYIAGRRRFRAFSIGGTSTTVTVNITAMSMPSHFVAQRQLCDVFAATNPFISVINGSNFTSSAVSTTLNSVTSVALIEGCKIVTLSGVFTGGTPTTGPTYTLQLSQDASNWFSTTSTITPGTVAGTYMTTLSNVCARYARLIVSTASSGGTPFTVSYLGINGTE